MVNKTNVPDAEDWKRMLDALPDLICTLDTEHKVLWMNAAMAKKLGVTQAEAKGLTCYEAVHGTNCPPDFCPHCQLLLDQQGHAVEVHEERLGGDFLVTCTPLTDKDGQLVGSIHVARDITGRERLLGDILNQAKEGFGCFRPDGTITEVNEALCRMLGYERSELFKFKATDLIANEEPEITANRINRIICGDNETFESAHLTKDGRVVPTELSLSYSPGHDLFFFFIRDITERKHAEDLQRRNEKDLRESQRIAHVGSWRLDVATNEVFWTEELYNMYGFDPSLPPPPYTEHMKLFTPESWERLSTALARTRDTGIPYTLELETVRKDGSNGWMWVRGEVDVDSAGKTVGLWGAAQDITERKRVEEALRESEEMFSTAFNTNPVPTGISTISDGRFLNVNNSFLETFSYSTKTEVIGKTSVEMGLYAHPEDRQSIRKEVEHKGSSKNRETEFVARDGRILNALFSAEKIVLNNEQCLLTTAVDITERKRVEEAIKEQAQMLDISPLSITVHDESGAFKYANEKTFAMHGYTRDEFMSLNLHQLDAPESESLISERMKLIAEKGEALFEVSHIRKDGSFIPLEVYVKKTNWFGRPALLSLARDITERKLAEKALAESEKRYRILVETANEGIWMMDGNHLTTYVNRAMAEMLGYQQSEMIGKKVEDFFFPEDSSFHKDKMAKRHAGVDEVYDRRFRCRDGSELWTTVSAKALSDEQGRFAGSFAMFTDITERKRTDEALRISEANLQAIMANTTDVIASYDREVRLLVFNKACAEIYRRLFNVELYPGLCMLDLFPEADREFWREKNARALGGESFSFEFELTFSDGCRLVFESTMHPIRQGNEVVGFTTTTRDITERKRSEEALRTSEARYRQAQAIGHVGNWEYNIQTTQFWGSDEAKRIYGFDPAQSNFSADEVEKCIPERERVHQALIDLIEADKPYNLEFEIIPRNSSESRIITSIAELEHDEHGDPFRVVGVIQDITERKQAEEEKEKLQAQLSQSQKMESVGRLAGGVAHDFNNMLQAILGHAELALLKVGPDETLYADLKEIQKAAQRSADLTRQLLAFARKQTVAPRVLDLNETVEGMLKMLRRLIGEDIDLAWLPGSNIGPVFMDPSQMDQILANLCVNARDAIAGTGKITIETDSVSFDEAYCANHAGFIPGEFVMLAVSDNGCGMDAGTLNHLFEPFFTTKDIGKGTGLGLATVYGAVSQNNGFVNVYSEPGHGTTFKIYLPLYAVRATPRPEQERAPAPAAGGETILLVEDEPAILKMTMLMLESMGYAIIAAATPGEAIRLAREHTGRIDLLMTDVVMPEMNGRELAVNLMSIYPDIRRLFMSGYTANVIAHQGVLDQGVHFIQKPFSMQVLSAKIREALNRE